MHKKLLSIGGGNMARAIIGGLLAQGYDQNLVSVVDPDENARAKVAEDFGVRVLAGLTEEIDTDIVLLAVKPQIMHGVATSLGKVISDSRPLIVSIAAGITTAQLSAWIGGEVPIVRVMPNTPALVGSGAAGLFATTNVTETEKTFGESIIASVGVAQWVLEEGQLDAVTALSGSGPAYFFLFIELLEKVAVEQGLESAMARKFAIETAYGAARLARESQDAPGVLREQVTSPGGTTAAALEVFHARDFEGLVREALGAAQRRSRELAELAG